MSGHERVVVSPFRQPKGVWGVVCAAEEGRGQTCPVVVGRDREIAVLVDRPGSHTARPKCTDP